MARYKHKLYPMAMIRAGSKRARFSDYELDTNDADIQAALDANDNVEKAPAQPQYADEGKPLEEMSRSELEDVAKYKGVQYISQYSNKSSLREAIEQVEE